VSRIYREKRIMNDSPLHPENKLDKEKKGCPLLTYRSTPNKEGKEKEEKKNSIA